MAFVIFGGMMMKLPLSDRLLACAGFVRPGDRVADIGCDHGYLGIHLLKNGVASAVVASDINEQPLHSAVRNAQKFGVQDRITFHLSDGARNIPRDFDCMVCAGMGADTMISILEAAPWLRNGQYRLILQCQSKIPMLRQYLSDNGWEIKKETVLRDGRFLYTIMEVCWDPDAPHLTLGQCYFSPALAECGSADLPAYYRWVVEGLRIATAHKNDAEKEQALRELTENEDLNWMEDA
jgi:tRNA (adenine22-N1)-methyltransferase